MNLSRDDLLRLESETGFRAATLEKVIRLGELADQIRVHAFLSSRLVLKGGTAIQLALGSPLRLSVDLDYNYIGQLDRDAMSSERPVVEAAIERVARASGYRLTTPAPQHAALRFLLGYRSLSGGPDRVELDVNYLMRQPLDEPMERELWQPEGFPGVRVRCVGEEELWAGKIVATLDRTMPRDLFDVAHLPTRSPRLVGLASFRGTAIAMCGILPLPMHAYGPKRLDRVDDAAIEASLRPMLSKALPIERESLARGAWAVLEPILQLTTAESEYCDRLQVGELRPELLFPDDESRAERVRRHPALLWKARHAKEHGARRGNGFAES